MYLDIYILNRGRNCLVKVLFVLQYHALVSRPRPMYQVNINFPISPFLVPTPRTVMLSRTLKKYCRPVFPRCCCLFVCSEWVYIFLVDPATNAPSTGIQTSYSCVTSETNSHVFTYMVRVEKHVACSCRFETVTGYRSQGSQSQVHFKNVQAGAPVE